MHPYQPLTPPLPLTLPLNPTPNPTPLPAGDPMSDDRYVRTIKALTDAIKQVRACVRVVVSASG